MRYGLCTTDLLTTMLLRGVFWGYGFWQLLLYSNQTSSPLVPYYLFLPSYIKRFTQDIR